MSGKDNLDIRQATLRVCGPHRTHSVHDETVVSDGLLEPLLVVPGHASEELSDTHLSKQATGNALLDSDSRPIGHKDEIRQSMNNHRSLALLNNTRKNGQRRRRTFVSRWEDIDTRALLPLHICRGVDGLLHFGAIEVDGGLLVGERASVVNQSGFRKARESMCTMRRGLTGNRGRPIGWDTCQRSCRR